MEQKNGDLCPLNKFKPCKKHECAWYTQIRGKNPNTGADIDGFGCSVAWLPLLLVENSNQARQTGAAVESFRNEVVRQNDDAFVSLSKLGAARQKLVSLQGEGK